MYRKLFSKNISVWQILLIGSGSFLGLLLVWLPLSLFFDISRALEEQKELIGSNYLVVNKSVSLLNAMHLSSTVFTEEELSEIKAIKGVQRVSPFLSGSFKAMASVNLGGEGTELMTEIFFEAVPSDFIDEVPENWQWREGQENLPVIVPADYLSLYNFGFAPGQNLPQISQGLAKMAGFKIMIEYDHSNVTLRGKIAGFSNRINTILVPLEFLQYANSHYSSQSQRPPSRIIIKAGDVSALAEYLRQMGYETNKETLRSGKVQSIAKVILALALGLGLLIVILSLGSFLQFAELLMARSDYEIQGLIFLGYGHAKVAKILFRQIFSVVIVAAGLAVAAGIELRLILLKRLGALVSTPAALPDLRSLVLLLIIVGAYLIIAFLNVYWRSAVLARPK